MHDTRGRKKSERARVRVDVQRRGDKDAIPDVRPRAVPQVMTEPRQLDALDVLVGDAERVVHVSEVGRHESGEVPNAWPRVPLSVSTRCLTNLDTHRDNARTGYARHRERHSTRDRAV